MFNGEIIIAKGSKNIGVTNHASLNISQKLSKDKKELTREITIELKKLYVYDGDFKQDDEIEGVIRVEEADKEVLKYFKGIILYLNMGMCKIRASGELTDNTEQFLKQIKRYEFSR